MTTCPKCGMPEESNPYSTEPHRLVSFECGSDMPALDLEELKQSAACQRICDELKQRLEER